MPEKHGIPKLCFDYELDVIHAILKYKHVWIKKAGGLGLTQLLCMFIAWKALKDDKWANSQVVILCGPRIDLAITLIDRIKALFPEIRFDSKETVVKLGTTHIEAFPSHLGLSAARGLPNVKLVFLDEADFFGSQKEWSEARTIAERYIGKSGASVVMVSTPNAPGGLFETIEKEPDDVCIYHRMILDYKVGLGKIYTDSEIQKARESPSFAREYEGAYIGLQGNVFSPKSIATAERLGNELYEARSGAIDYNTEKSCGIDPGFTSDNFAVVVCQRNPTAGGIIEVIYCREFDRVNLSTIIPRILNLKDKINIHKFYVDASQPVVVNPLKEALGERLDWHKEVAEHKARHQDPKLWLTVNPVAFNPEGKEMLARTKQFLDAESLAISPQIGEKLLIALRTAFATDGRLNKQVTAHDDILDALMLSLKQWRFRGGT